MEHRYPYTTTSSPEHPEEKYKFLYWHPQVASRMQNDIIRISSGTKNVHFTASRGAPREFPKNIPKEGLRKITGTNIGEIKETSRSHGVLRSQNASYEILRKI